MWQEGGDRRQLRTSGILDFKGNISNLYFCLNLINIIDPFFTSISQRCNFYPSLSLGFVVGDAVACVMRSPVIGQFVFIVCYFMGQVGGYYLQFTSVFIPNNTTGRGEILDINSCDIFFYN